MKIITLTVNPAYDLHLRCTELVPLRDNPAQMLRKDEGGKGINVSRALSSHGVDSLCYLTLGQTDALRFSEALCKCGLRVEYDTVRGEVRENMHIHSPAGDTVISTAGPAVTSEAVQAARDRLLPLMDSGTVVCFSGRIADGSDKEGLLSLLRNARAMGARLVLDSKSLSAEEIFSLSPYLIKPNLEEAEALLSARINGIGEAIYAANKLYERAEGRVQNLLLTLGHLGAVLVSRSGVYKSSLPKIEAVSTSGAGDSTIAGFLYAESAGCTDTDKLRYAVAFGSAACLREGSLPPLKEDTARLFSETEIYSM